MIVEVQQYIPHVECENSPDLPDLGVCGHILKAMPASEHLTIFGNEPRAPGVEEVLPIVYADHTGLDSEHTAFPS